jgi:hypothetical protein
MIFLKVYRSDGTMLWESRPGMTTCYQSSDRFILATGAPLNASGLPRIDAMPGEVLETGHGYDLPVLTPAEYNNHSASQWLIAPDGAFAIPCRPVAASFAQFSYDIVRNSRLLSRSAPYREFQGTCL